MKSINLLFVFAFFPCIAGIGLAFTGGADCIITLKEPYHDSATFRTLQEEYALSAKFPAHVHGMMSVRLPPGMSYDVAQEILSNDSRVAFIEPDYVVHTTDMPNDPLFRKQWSLYNPDNTRADIKAPEAWRLHTGSRKIIIAILDTGLNYKHPDLIDNLWVNTREIPGNNADDDHNGFVDDVYGWDFAYHTNDPMDRYFHGTHVAGIIGAVTNNDMGMAGIMHHVSLMGVKGISDGGWGFSSDLIAGIYYAVDNGARVINASWGGGGYLEAMAEALEYAKKHNVIVVASAGNYHGNNDETPFYPASYPGDNIIAVGASTPQDSMAYFSHYGKTTVDLFAPGVDNISTALGDTYRYGTGTSMASPHVSGVVGLLFSISPTLRYDRAIEVVLNTVEQKPYMEHSCVSGGRLDAFGALQAVSSGVAGGQVPDGLIHKIAVVMQLLEHFNPKERDQ
jgi:subtilisin family serine protease